MADSISDEELLRRAVKSARSYLRGRQYPRWAAVIDVFAIGAASARQLCLRFDVAPDEQVKR